MINLRYHIVSIVAVFLALGIGTALGGTFLNSYTVDLLEQNISSAEDRIAATSAENSELEGAVASAEARERALLADAGGELLGDHLADVPILLVTAPGVAGEDTEELRLALLDAGADYRGAIELRDGLALEGDIDDRLAEVVGLDPATPGLVREELIRSFQQSLLAAGAQPPDPAEPEAAPTTTAPAGSDTTVAPTTTLPETDPGAGAGAGATTVPEGDAPDPFDPLAPDGMTPPVITAMLEADLIRLTPGPGRADDDPVLEQTGYRFVFVGRPGLDAMANELLLQLLSADPDLDATPAVVVSATVPADAQDPAPTAVATVRADEDLVDRYSTVDDTDRFAGLVSTVLALEDLPGGTTGHYGEADGASSILPPRP